MTISTFAATSRFAAGHRLIDIAGIIDRDKGYLLAQDPARLVQIGDGSLRPKVLLLTIQCNSTGKGTGYSYDNVGLCNFPAQRRLPRQISM